MSSPAALRARIMSPALPWRLVFCGVLVLLAVAPLLLEPFRLNLLAKYLCYAIVGLGIGLAWGHGGMLTLGQGLFFGLGGYAMGMYLKLHDAGPGNVPDFMSWSGVETLPTLWEPFRSPFVAITAVVLVPALVAGVLGMLIFRQRVRGAYFAILTQALAAAFAILLVGQQGLTGGTNGLTNFSGFFGINTYSDDGRRTLYFIVAGSLLVIFLLLRLLVRSRFGRLLTAIRDGEDRVRFLGYDPTIIKTLTFVIAAVTASVAGALFVPVVGIINPGLLDIVPSIELVVAVAVGGRFSLIGAMVGAVLVNWAKTTFSEEFPSGWVYFQGALFIGVIAFAPRGLTGLFQSARGLVADRIPGSGWAATPGTAAVGRAATPAQRPSDGADGTPSENIEAAADGADGVVDRRETV